MLSLHGRRGVYCDGYAAVYTTGGVCQMYKACKRADHSSNRRTVCREISDLEEEEIFPIEGEFLEMDEALRQAALQPCRIACFAAWIAGAMPDLRVDRNETDCSCEMNTENPFAILRKLDLPGGGVTMAVPKRKTSKTRRDKRRTHANAPKVTVAICQQCKSLWRLTLLVSSVVITTIRRF